MKSSLIKKWKSVKYRSEVHSLNIRASLVPLLADDKFSLFLLIALHLTSKKSHHESHAVCVMFSFGRGLGQVKNIERFQVRTTKLFN
jgi:hypothetical protein